jgi:hypothetical protein
MMADEAICHHNTTKCHWEEDDSLLAVSDPKNGHISIFISINKFFNEKELEIRKIFDISKL